MEHAQRRFRPSDLPMYLGYAVSAVTFFFGAVVASGYLMDARIPVQFRVTFGVVLMLMGVYRFVLTRAKIRQWKIEDEQGRDE